MNPVIVFLMFSTSFGIPMSANSGQPVRLQLPDLITRVKVDVSARDDIKQALHSYIGQSFQSLPGVRLVENDPSWTIKIVTITVQDNEGNVSALGLSVVVLKHGLEMDLLRTLTQAWHHIIKAGLLQKDQPLEVGMRQLIDGIDRLPQTDDLAVLSQHRMCLIPVPKLAEACHDIVMDFNSRFLQPSESVAGDGKASSNGVRAPAVSLSY